MEIDKYLARINYSGSRSPTVQVLNVLQKQHLLNIPFENLDIHYKIPIELELTSIFKKVVDNGRGGFCYELNGLFYELLRLLRFDVKMVSARVFDNERQEFSREFDHLAIIATIDSSAYLVDVGFGEFALLPLKLELNKKQHDDRGVFRIEKYDEPYYKVSKLVGENWSSEYIFSLKERQFSEFSDMCLYHQTSLQSHFTQNKMCSLATMKGRITITNNKIKIKDGDSITELNIDSEEEFLLALEKYFKIKLNSIAE